MSFKAHRTLDSGVQIDIAGTYTLVPGMQSFTPDPGENSTFESGDLTSDYDKLKATGVGGGGSVSGSKLFDPLDPVDLYLQAVFNNGGTPVTATTNYEGVPGKVIVSDTGVEWDFDGILTKWAPKSEKKSGWMVDYDFKLADRMELNEVAPA